jgi:hypothetical protein
MIPLAFQPTVWVNGAMDTGDTFQVPALNELVHMSQPQLRTHYEKLLKASPPKSASAGFLRGNIAWSIQASELGKAPALLRESLMKTLARPGPSSCISYKPGTRLIREWNGCTYEVTILEKGYLWQGNHYRSLSRIAQEITGTKWSGPRFFGLMNKTNDSSE